MIIGILKVKISIPENHTLKGKRQVIKPIITKVKNKFNVSIAETDDQELWQIATLGIACVSNINRHANQILSEVIKYIDSLMGDANILDYEIEITQAC